MVKLPARMTTVTPSSEAAYGGAAVGRRANARSGHPRPCARM